MKRISLVLASLVLLLATSLSWALGPEDVYLLVNKNVAASREIAEYYRDKRGGPWMSLLKRLRRLGVDVPVCLTDYDPNIESFERAHKRSGGVITFHTEPVDATRVPAELTGLRTMFSAFHHLRPEQVRAALADAVAIASSLIS